jgi:2'-5' RNA ligase
MSTRTFIAIELTPGARAALARRIEQLRRALPQVRWVNPASLHLTLAFLGELDDSALAGATGAAVLAAQENAPFELHLSGLGTFGPPAAPRVVWSGIGGDTRALQRLHDTLARRLVERGLPADDTHAFSPHLTLARLKQRLPARDAERLSAAIAASQTSQTAHTTPQLSLLVEHIAVMKSDLLPSGARYTCLRSCPLGTASSGASAVSGE